MRKIFFILLILFLLYFGLEGVFFYWGPGHTSEYEVNGYKIKEIFTNNQFKEIKSYNLLFTKDDFSIELQVFSDYENISKIVESIREYNKNNIHCILPIYINNKIESQIICKKDGIVYNYNNLKGTDKELDEFYSSVSSFYPQTKDYKDLKNGIELYSNNVLKNYNFSLVTDKGFIIVDNNKKVLIPFNIFSLKVSNLNLSEYVNNYFVTVNYDEKNGYNIIYLYNISSGRKDEIKLAQTLSTDSYIEGIYQNSMYIFDKNNRKQFQINIETKSIKEIGNDNLGVQILKNDTWTKLNLADAMDTKFSSDLLIDSENYTFINKVGNMKTGYSYYYKKNNEKYDIYRANNYNTLEKMYLFSTNYLEGILLKNEFVFYADGNKINYYSDNTGIKTLIANSSDSSNEKMKYQIFYENRD